MARVGETETGNENGQAMATPPTTVVGLADAIGIDVIGLQALADHPPYNRWRVPKRSGGWRQIEAPACHLKKAQRWILHHVLPRLRVHEAAHGSVRGRSAVTFAAEHAAAGTLLRMDIRSFFPSVGIEHVRRALGTVLAPDVARVTALLCCAGSPRALPQGAPTSPSLANAAFLRADQDLEALACSFGARYTRYVDDLAFSWRSASDPTELAGLVRLMLARHGFEAHPDKTKIMRPHERQELVGLVLNGDGPPRPSRSAMRRLRAAVHQASGAPPSEIRRIQGMIAYVSMSNPARGRKLRRQLDENLARKANQV